MSRVPSTEVASLPYTSRDWTLQDICHHLINKRFTRPCRETPLSARVGSVEVRPVGALNP